MKLKEYLNNVKALKKERKENYYNIKNKYGKLAKIYDFLIDVAIVVLMIIVCFSFAFMGFCLSQKDIDTGSKRKALDPVAVSIRKNAPTLDELQNPFLSLEWDLILYQNGSFVDNDVLTEFFIDSSEYNLFNKEIIYNMLSNNGIQSADNLIINFVSQSEPYYQPLYTSNTNFLLSSVYQVNYYFNNQIVFTIDNVPSVFNTSNYTSNFMYDKVEFKITKLSNFSLSVNNTAYDIGYSNGSNDMKDYYIDYINNEYKGLTFNEIISIGKSQAELQNTNINLGDIMSAVITAPIQFLNQSLNFTIPGTNINIMFIVQFILTCLIVAFAVKFFKGGV